MRDPVVVTVLVENTAYSVKLMGEHGLAFHVQIGEKSLLFDTGQSRLLTRNAKRLGVDLSRIDAVALSHGHYDHTGGLRAVWALAPLAPLHAHPGVRIEHWARNPDGTARAIGISSSQRSAILAHDSQVHFNTSSAEPLPGIHLTGEIPRSTDFEDVGGPFFLDKAVTKPDPIADDQALFFDTREGLVVLLGCAHAGVVNTVRQIRRLTHDRPIHALLGGMHLAAAGPRRMNSTVEALRELNIQRLGPAHCTGPAAAARLWHEFPKACVPCVTGSQFTFPR